jgi:hypothetical protein
LPDHEPLETYAEPASVLAEPEIEWSRWVRKAQFEEHSASLGACGRWKRDVEKAEGFAVTEDATGEGLVERRDFDFEVGMIGGHEGANGENEFAIFRADIRWPEEEGRFVAVRPDSGLIWHRPSLAQEAFAA